jgi:hypothetical protein
MFPKLPLKHNSFSLVWQPISVVPPTLKTEARVQGKTVQYRNTLSEIHTYIHTKQDPTNLLPDNIVKRC